MATAPKAVPKAAPRGAPEADDQMASAAPGKSKKKLVLLLIILLVVLGAGGGAAWYFMGGKSDPNAPEAKARQPAKPPVFMVIEPFTVNLQPDGAGDQFLQVAFSLQVDDQKDVDNIKSYLPQVRSRLLLLLSAKKASEISTLEGKKKLAEDIIMQVKQPFVPDSPPQNVKNVFFTSFVIQ